MKTCPLLPLVAFFFAAYPLLAEMPHTATSPADVPSQVLAAHDASVAAAEARNLPQLFAGLADNDTDAIILNGRLISTKAELMANTRQNFRGLAKVKYAFDSRHVTVLGPDAALLVVTGNVLATTDQGETFSRPFAHSLVYIRQNGAWRVLHSHQSNPIDARK